MQLHDEGRKGMGDLLKHVCKEVHREEIQTQLKADGRAFLDTHEVSAQEAPMHVLSMHLMQKSQQVNFIDTTPKETHIVMPKGNIVQMNPDEDIFAIQIHDRYASRPVELESMTLAHFATKLAVVYSGKVMIQNLVKQNQMS